MPVMTGRTITQAIITQGAAGALDLVAAPGVGLKVHVVSFIVTLTANGTLKFTEGVGPTDLTGAMSIAANGGMVAIGSEHSVLSTNTANSKLSLLTTGGAATGFLRYFIAP